VDIHSVLTQRTCIYTLHSTKNATPAQKSPIYTQKSPTITQKSPIYMYSRRRAVYTFYIHTLQATASQGALHLHKSVLNKLKRALHSHKRALYTYTHSIKTLCVDAAELYARSIYSHSIGNGLTLAQKSRIYTQKSPTLTQ